jgi:Fe-S cluster assembly protein SufD
MENNFLSSPFVTGLLSGKEMPSSLQGLSFSGIAGEAWKYTDLGLLFDASFRVSSFGWSTVFPSGVEEVSLKYDPALFATPNDAKEFLSLHEVFATVPLMIDIPAEVAPVGPLRLLYEPVQISGPGAFFPRAVLKVGANARARVLQMFNARGAGVSYTGDLTDIILEPGAQLDILQVFLNHADSFQISHTRVFQKKDSALRSFQLTKGSSLFRNNFSVILDDQGASADISGLHQLDGISHADSHTLIEHRAPNATSRQLYKSILDGESRSVFNGRVMVRREAQQTSSYQLNKNLLLSRGARVDTKPQLEIFADDVKCTHGATIGQLSDEQLFYLQTRGLKRDAARRMLIRGFVDDVVGQVRDPGLRDDLKKAIL